MRHFTAIKSFADQGNAGEAEVDIQHAMVEKSAAEAGASDGVLRVLGWMFESDKNLRKGMGTYRSEVFANRRVAETKTARGRTTSRKRKKGKKTTKRVNVQGGSDSTSTMTVVMLCLRSTCCLRLWWK